MRVVFMLDYFQGDFFFILFVFLWRYDMEDAMIINKSSYERGFGHGAVHVTKDVFIIKYYYVFILFS
jgi:DNA-directed RNA polymerase beta subunit